jgi:hypothetical protein
MRIRIQGLFDPGSGMEKFRTKTSIAIMNPSYKTKALRFLMLIPSGRRIYYQHTEEKMTYIERQISLPKAVGLPGK